MIKILEKHEHMYPKKGTYIHYKLFLIQELESGVLR